MNYKNLTLLELVEDYGINNNLISSEEELSERFDSEVLPSVIEQYGEDDQDAIDQAFNDWTDYLCKDGEIHEEQYKEYTYVGKFQ